MRELIFNKLYVISIPSILCSKQKCTALRQPQSFQLSTESQGNTLASNTWLHYSPKHYSLPQTRLSVSSFNHLFRSSDRQQKTEILLLLPCSAPFAAPYKHLSEAVAPLSAQWASPMPYRVHLCHNLEQKKCIPGRKD